MMSSDDWSNLHFAVASLGIMGVLMGINAWISFVMRPYAIRKRREAGDASRVYLLEIETIHRKAASDGDASARRHLAILKRLAQAMLFFMLLFTAHFVIW